MSMKNLIDRFAKDAAAYGPRALDAHIARLGELIEDGNGPTRQDR